MSDEVRYGGMSKGTRVTHEKYGDGRVALGGVIHGTVVVHFFRQKEGLARIIRIEELKRLTGHVDPIARRAYGWRNA